MTNKEIEHLKRENEWLKAAIIKHEGEETLKQWMAGHSFYMQGMLDERQSNDKAKTDS